MVKMTLKRFAHLPIVEDVIYIGGGILLAFFIYNALGMVLSTDKPVLTVVSGSMEPTLNIGDLIVIRGADSLEIEVGDIIVFNPVIVDKLVVHRVYSISEDLRIDEVSGEESVVRYFRTKGDNNVTNSHVDPWILSDGHIRGVCQFHIPYLGYPRILVTNLIDYIAFKVL